jgi:hypothetical protein
LQDVFPLYLKETHGKSGKNMKKMLLTNACVFFLAFTALVFLVFLAGNFQGFTASSLFLVLDILKFSSFLCFAAGIIHLCCLIFFFSAAREPSFLRPKPRDIIFAVLCLFFGLGILLLSQFILGLTLPKF